MQTHKQAHMPSTSGVACQARPQAAAARTREIVRGVAEVDLEHERARVRLGQGDVDALVKPAPDGLQGGRRWVTGVAEVKVEWRWVGLDWERREATTHPSPHYTACLDRAAGVLDPPRLRAMLCTQGRASCKPQGGGPCPHLVQIVRQVCGSQDEHLRIVGAHALDGGSKGTCACGAGGGGAGSRVHLRVGVPEDGARTRAP